ncbi:MAG: hypothetical protein UU67_C0071G0013 [Candidatus Daviesbacteria bacterium GW2011_GWB1_41_5]|uniref:DUF1361 domain-containing protein n=2 Tax=Candidatus Daviesiibacteriota TaxID=1752718 RepID=A0A0G0WHL3_9BACT|nr:MAG: hypothetical protein UU67_C0071G0013 [Candidatus Daviesbacteria bacterium GW2011_GWB1_41_5]
MEFVSENMSWITLNVSLAVLAVIFGVLFYLMRGFWRFIFFILWILFIPNTIYMVTDIQYLPGQLIKTQFSSQILLTGQYLIIASLGVITYFLGIYPFEQIISKRVNKTSIPVIIFLANYLIAFGIFLGKIYRVHSWFIFTSPQSVAGAISDILASPLILLAIFLFGTFTNFVYFIVGPRLGVKVWTKRCFMLR